ncbi:RHS repeat-associated core domain-containing protein [Chitinophaga rhizosphaerae]|uniref:RHS repeat-associated core domain-containing protein n=1 Tax=Chitinophaga rhizosphaerae TaxID=1864947 RepID=UPI000F81327E|nr:RHS repeat-associated core domain-containing protein [Chitinophaga rhizosphaerae]
MRTIARLSFILCLLASLLAQSMPCFAAVEPYQQQLTGRISQGDTLLLKDEKFQNPVWNWSLISNHKVSNEITFSLIRSQLHALGKSFTAEVDLKVEYWSQPNQADPIVQDHVKLTVNYDHAQGAAYASQDVYRFQNGHKVKITVNSISSAELGAVLPEIFTLTSQVFVDRSYIRDANAAPVGVFAAESGQVNRVLLNWTAPPGAEHYDLEWTFIDETSALGTLLQNTPANQRTPAFLHKFFRNNATRVTLDEQGYNINLVHFSRFLLVRVREVAVNAVTGLREEEPWVYDMSFTASGGSATPVKGVIELTNTWHHADLNWQYNATYAEEGKRKEVVSYFDKSLKNRQTVTLLNNGNVVSGTADVTAIAQSTIYDEYGRAAVNILPAPLFGRDALDFYPQLNKLGNGTALNFQHVGAPGLNCDFVFQPLGTQDGAGRYYSPLNDYRTQGNHKFVPDAEGFPFSAQFYTNDNTGRISSQGGVGKQFQPNRDPSVANMHSTRYFYSKPSKEELFRMFGNDVGQASHYSKNTVIDPNGQISVSYLNLSGKTIATALSGKNPENLDALASRPDSVERTNTVFSPEDFSFEASRLQLTANQTYIAEQAGEMKFRLNVPKLVSKYTNGSVNICSECAYEVVVTVFDDCLDDAQKATRTKEYSVAGTAPSLTCSVQPADLDKEFTLNFTKAGAYYITMEIRMKEALIRQKADQFVDINSTLGKQFDFIQKELDSLDLAGCFSDCRTCKTALGTRTGFIQRVRDKMASLGANLTTNGAQIDAWAGGRFDALSATCTTARQTCGDDPCEDLRKRMRMDVSPGGQYALLTADSLPLEPDMNVLALNWRTVWPVKAEDEPGYSQYMVQLENGDSMSINDTRFSLKLLYRHWKPAYADKFLNFHPEYCGLRACDSNRVYLQWDERIGSMVETTADFSEFSLPAPFSTANGTWLANIDPFFANGARGADYKAAFVNDLASYSLNVKKINQAATKHLGAYIDYMLYCSDDKPADPYATFDIKIWTECAPPANCRVPDREWQMYKKAYFELKQQYYQQLRDSVDCKVACKVGQPISVSPGGCPVAEAFTVVADSVFSSGRRVTIRHEGGPMVYSTTVNLYYPDQYLGTPGLILSRSFVPGQWIDSFYIPATVPGTDIRVKAVSCQYPNSGAMPCNGTAYTLDLGTSGRKTGYNTWDGVSSGNAFRQYFIQRGLRDSLPNLANYCTGADTAYYNCLTIQYNGILEYIQNAWLISCPPATCASSGSFTATSRTNDLVFSNSTNLIEIVPFTAPNSGVTSTQCGSPSSAWYECFTVTLNGNTYYYRNARVFTCAVSPPCTPDADYSYTAAYNGIYFENDNPLDPKTYVVSNSVGCPMGTTEFNTVYFTCVRFGPAGGYSGSTFYFQNTRVVMCNGVSSGAGLMSTPPETTMLLWPGGGEGGGGSGGGTCPPGFQFKQSRLNEVNFNAPLDQQQLRAEGTAQYAQYQQSTCTSQADLWLDRLEPCFDKFTNSTIKAQKRAALKDKLIELCSKGVDVSHPYGASTLPTGITIPGGGSSFREVIKTIIDITQFSPDCNPWLLDGPYPYNTPLLAANTTISNSSPEICKRLAAYKQAFTNEGTGTFHQYMAARFGEAMTMSAAELADLEQSCDACKYILKKDVELPLFLGADSKGCITKTELTAAWAAVESEVPGLTAGLPEYERIITNYLNHKWGFGLGYTAYLKLKENTNANATLCNTAPFKSTPPDPYACLLAHLHTATINGLRSYDQYIAEVKRQYRQDYISACGKAAGGLKVTYASTGTYHYTLYYYDQAGNLVKTVPPEGVRLLSDAGMAAMTEAAKAEENCFYGGPETETDIGLTKQYVQSSLNAGTHAIEMWLYNNEMPLGQVLMTTGVDGYMVNACLGEHFMDVDIYKLGSTAPGIDFQRARYFRVSMNKDLMRPMMHVVLQGNNMGLDNGTLAVYVNGELRPAVTSDVPAACSWEINFENGQPKLPQNSSTLKHVRGYSTTLSAAQVLAQYNMACLGLSNGVASVPREHWGRFNIAPPGSATTSENTGRESRYTKVYPQHGLNSTYSFNTLNGVVAQETPDGGASQFWYDWIGRLVASRNAIQKGRLSYTEYDPQSRIIEVGERDGIGWNKPFLTMGETNAFIAGGKETRRYFTVTEYDTVITGSYGTGANAELVEANIAQENLRKRVSATKIYETPTSEPVATFYSYDMVGNVKTLLHKLPDFKFKRIDYSYDLASGKVRTVRYRHDQNSYFYYDYRYDAENRLTKAYSGVSAGGADGWSVINPKLEAAYYYYRHGPLARMELGTNVQGVDYAYTLQGWLKAINGEQLAGANDMGQDGVVNTPNAPFQKDVYAFSLNYFSEDYKSIARGNNEDPVFNLQWDYTTAAAPGRQLFNGNIARTTLAMSKFDNGAPKGYAYRYDQLNRLTQMQQHANSGTGMAAAGLPFAESVEYDANGNILAYKRNGNRDNMTEAPMDDLRYGYEYDYNTDGTKKLLNNRLQVLRDEQPVASRYEGDLDGTYKYAYDSIGNLVRDSESGVEEIKWTVYGKIASIRKTDGTLISYRYDAAGNRIYKDILKNAQTQRTWYVRDAQGNSLAVYGQSSAASAPSLQEQHLYGTSRLGIWSVDVAGSESYLSKWNGKDGKTLYELTNHLGNVVSTVSGAYDGSGEATVMSMTDFYPFGMVMPGRMFNLEGSSYRYGFNGKENDNEVKGIEGSQQDYGMRIYDPRVGKFLSVDPLTKSFSMLTPYQFASNSPVQAIDLDGLESYYYGLAMNKDGKLSLSLQKTEDLVEKVQVGFTSTSASSVAPSFQPIYKEVVNQSQSYYINGRKTSQSTVNQFLDRGSNDPLTSLALNKIESDFKNFGGRFPDTYYADFGSFLFSTATAQAKPSLVEYPNTSKMSAGMSTVMNFVDNEKGFGGGKFSSVYHAYENVVRRNDNTGYDKLLHFTFSADKAFSLGARMSGFLGVMKEVFKDEIPSWFTDDIGWDDQDMRANRLGIDLGSQLRTLYRERYNEETKAAEAKNNKSN